MHASLLILLIRGLAIVAVAFGPAAWGDEHASAQEPLSNPVRINPILNPVTLLSQAITSLLPGADERMRSWAESEAGLSVDFASGSERDRVSLSLAESQLRVRLGEDLHLNCEVSSNDELDAAPELGIDLAIQFKFQ